MNILDKILINFALDCDNIDAGVNGVTENNCGASGGQVTDLFGTTGIINKIINLMLFAVGLLSIIMIIFGGIRFIVAGGNKDQVDSAKKTVIYALIGLIVALLAYAAVSFVVKNISGDSVETTAL